MDEVLQRVHNISTVKLHYIGETDGNKTTCKHGPLECDGDKQQVEAMAWHVAHCAPRQALHACIRCA